MMKRGYKFHGGENEPALFPRIEKRMKPTTEPLLYSMSSDLVRPAMATPSLTMFICLREI
jgi:hypothetical protein